MDEKEYVERESVLKCAAEDGYDCEYDLGCWSHNAEFQELIKEIPAADVVEVTRCKDCYQSLVIEDVLYCTYWRKNTDENGYCHEGG